MSEKILLAMSGGVDSAVAALRLRQAGHELSAAYMRTWLNEDGADLFSDCPWEEDIRAAEAVAAHLGIPFEVVNLMDAYHEKVVQYMVDGYRRGLTPNPDIMCNREMKFGVFLDYALKEGFDAVATGHYCRLLPYDDGSVDLLEGADPLKDQSYFLAMVRQAQLRRARFPVGDLHKATTRALAREAGLPNAGRKDSQGICFLGKVDINAFLRRYIPDRPGDIVRVDGTVLGRHKGLHHFTLGQRRGIGIPSNTDFQNYVVVAKDLQRNELRVAFDAPTAPGLYQGEVILYDLNWTRQAVTSPRRLLAKPRYRDPAVEADFIPLGADRAKVSFAVPQRALATGQVLALYDGDRLLGGGFYA